MKVKDAVRISSSIPIWYEAVKRKDSKGESILVDGGLAWNYPIDIFDYEHFVEDPVNIVYYASSKKNVNYETLGFRLEPFKDPLHNFVSAKDSSGEINNWIDYAKSFLRFMHASTMRRHLDAEDWVRTVYVDTLEIGAADFNITQSDKLRLIDEGSTGVYKHFSWKMSRDGVKFPQ
jgi:NTE family protein